MRKELLKAKTKRAGSNNQQKRTTAKGYERLSKRQAKLGGKSTLKKRTMVTKNKLNLK